MSDMRAELEQFCPDRDTVLTIGVFDGVHLGHQALIGRTVATAAEQGLVPAVLTFHPHPRRVLAPDRPFFYLASLDERIERIRALGVELVVPLTFTREVARTTAGDFVALLVHCLRMCHLVVGPDFALGRGREGTIDFLRERGAESGFAVTVVEPRNDVIGRISSTAIRRTIEVGDMDVARRLLGRHFDLSGLVVRGDGRGRELGFPTANLDVDPDLLLPANGIYVCRARLGDQLYDAVTNVGVRPTFVEDARRLVEVFLLDFDRDISGQELVVEFLHRLRPEQRFDSAGALVEQMHRDVAEARALLQSATT